jgi:hypothetical protein
MGDSRILITAIMAALFLAVAICSTHYSSTAPSVRSRPVSVAVNQRIKPFVHDPTQVPSDKPCTTAPIAAGRMVANRSAKVTNPAGPSDWIRNSASGFLMEKIPGEDFSSLAASENHLSQPLDRPKSEIANSVNADRQKELLDTSILNIPVALCLNTISATSVHVAWQSTEGALGYNVYLCEDDGTYWSDCYSVDVETNQAELNELKPDSRYRLDIVAFDRDRGESEPSESLYLETLGPNSGPIDIPPMKSTAALVINSACYNDCANMYALMIHRGIAFNLKACRQKCEL